MFEWENVMLLLTMLSPFSFDSLRGKPRALSTRLSALVLSHVPVPDYAFTPDGRHKVFAVKK